MPRENIHWYVVDRAIEELEACGAVFIAKILKENIEMAYLGALAHDVPYYYRFGGHPFENVAAKLHGTYGEDTFLPIKHLGVLIGKEVEEQRREMAWAFLFGMMTHYAADISLHPFIFYFTGNYHDKDETQRHFARGRHRLLEVYLDSWIVKVLKKPYPSILSIVSKRKAEIKIVSKIMSTLAHTNDEAIRIQHVDWWESGYLYLAWFQKFFFSNLVGSIVRILSHTFWHSLSDIDALFAFGRNKPEPIFDRPLQYQNPVTGAAETKTVIETIEDSVRHSVELGKCFEEFLNQKVSSIEQAFEGERGKSLNLGEYSVGRYDAKYFSNSGIALPGLEIS